MNTVLAGTFLAGLVLFLAVALKGLKLPFAARIPFRFPLTLEEKLAIKNYYGVADLPGHTARYREQVLEAVLASMPMVLAGLAAGGALPLIGLALAYWGYRSHYLRMTKEIRRWKTDFYKRYPGFLNDLKMYLQSGLTLENSLALYFEKGTDCHYLDLLRRSITNIRFGKSRKEAFLEVINQTRERELIHLINYFIQHVQLGTEDSGYLNHLSDDAWKLKKETVRKLAEEGSAKMVLPMMLIFVGLTILILVPSVFSLADKNIF